MHAVDKNPSVWNTIWNDPCALCEGRKVGAYHCDKSHHELSWLELSNDRIKHHDVQVYIILEFSKVNSIGIYKWLNNLIWLTSVSWNCYTKQITQFF